MASKFDSARLDVVAAFSTRPVNALASVASIVGLLIAVLNEFTLDSSGIVLGYLCALSLFLLLRYVRQDRWARYAEAAQVMERAHRRLKEVSDRTFYGDDSGRELFLTGLQESLSAFAEAFTLVTGTNCRASIKEVFAEDSLPPAGRRGEVAQPISVTMVATLTRSNVDASRRARHEPAEPVKGNTDFEASLESQQPWFSNDLPALRKAGEYENSHWGAGQERQGSDYRSAIVWPIEVEPPLDGAPEEDRERVIAFLCLDSRRRNAFRKRADVAFGGAYAHALYPVLRYALASGGTDNGA